MRKIFLITIISVVTFGFGLRMANSAVGHIDAPIKAHISKIDAAIEEASK